MTKEQIQKELEIVRDALVRARDDKWCNDLSTVAMMVRDSEITKKLELTELFWLYTKKPICKNDILPDLCRMEEELIKLLAKLKMVEYEGNDRTQRTD